MVPLPLFLDDKAVTDSLHRATDAAIQALSETFPNLGQQDNDPFREQLYAHLAAMLTGRAAASFSVGKFPALAQGDDAFGDYFCLEELPLPRRATGYAVQLLDTDTILDSTSKEFRPVRNSKLRGLFPSFNAARLAAKTWLKENRATIKEHPLAIVPAYYDSELERHVLIYGVLTRSP